MEVGKDFSTWITDRIKQGGFVPGVDFEIFDSPISGNQSGRGGDRRSKDYALSLDMAKHLAMMERTPKGKEARRCFIGCGRVLREVGNWNPSGALPGKFHAWFSSKL